MAGKWSAAWRLAALLALVGCGAAPAPSEADPAAVFLVRHAEKEKTADDPALTAAGRARAEELARVLADSGVRAVYSTDFARTRDTAAPMSARIGAEIRIYDWAKLDELAAELSQPGARSLVVGHSDTTPELVEALGGDRGEPIDEPNEYDRLYIVTIAPDGAVTTVLLRYGD